MTRPDIEGIDALFAKAPQGKLFETDESPYLHFAKDGIAPPAPDKVPYAFPVYGRFDYGDGAKDFVREIHNNWPALREYIAELEKDARLWREKFDNQHKTMCSYVRTDEQVKGELRRKLANATSRIARLATSVVGISRHRQ